jgi:hypothetical protein
LKRKEEVSHSPKVTLKNHVSQRKLVMKMTGGSGWLYKLVGAFLFDEMGCYE